MSVFRWMGPLALALLVSGTALAEEEGYKPIRIPPEQGGEVAGEPLEAGEPVARVHLRAFFRFTYLSGSDEVAHDGGTSIFADAPSFNRAFQPGVGGGFDLVYTVVPLFSIQYNVTFQYFAGRKISSGLANPGDTVDFEDFWNFETSIGPRLNFPVDLSSDLWTVRRAVPLTRGLVPYIRLGLGYALTGDVEYTHNGRQRDFYASTASFHLILGVGTEYHGERWGGFVEMFFVDRFGPLDTVAADADGIAVIGLPFSFGVTYRY